MSDARTAFRYTRKRLIEGANEVADELGYIRGVGPHAWLAYPLAFLGEFTELEQRKAKER